MSLEDEIKRMREELAAAEQPEQEQEEQEEVQEEEQTPEQEQESKVEEPKAEEPKKEELDNAGYARLRREADAERKRREQAENEREQLRLELERLTSGNKQESQETAVELPAEINELIEETRVTKAEREFMALEEKFKREVPEYDDIAQQYVAALAQSIKLQNPRISAHELVAETKKTILRKAGTYVNAGYDPIQELYHEAIELGFKPRPKQEAAETELKEQVQPDMKKVAQNRKRNAGMAGASGQSEGQVTMAVAAAYSPAEWKKLPAAEKRRLMYGN